MTSYVTIFERMKVKLMTYDCERSPSSVGWFICNTDNASKGNPGPSATAICVKNSERIILGVKGRRIIDFKNLITEVVTIREGV